MKIMCIVLEGENLVYCVCLYLCPELDTILSIGVVIDNKRKD